MYPLLLKPAVKEYLWGGNRLKTDFGLESDAAVLAEGWMLSCHKDGVCTVLNGEHSGKPLTDVLSLWGEQASSFPLLIKLIDAKQNLSVQVHPDDAYAAQHEGECGKTEMWYVVDCDEGAELIYGFKQSLSKEALKTHIENNTLLDVCNRVSVKKGDVFFIPAGTLHAIGGGMLIAEVQQNSNATYRVFDYGRIGNDGKPRPLHIEKALDVTQREPSALSHKQTCKTTLGKNTISELAACELFCTNLLTLKEPFPIHRTESFVSLVCLNGSATILWGSETLAVKKGDSVFIPANLPVTVDGIAELLYTYL